MPDAPQAENFVSEKDFAEAQERYESRMSRFAEQTQQLEFDISEGRVRKYAVIGNLDIRDPLRRDRGRGAGSDGKRGAGR